MQTHWTESVKGSQANFATTGQNVELWWRREDLGGDKLEVQVGVMVSAAT